MEIIISTILIIGIGAILFFKMTMAINDKALALKNDTIYYKKSIEELKENKQALENSLKEIDDLSIKYSDFQEEEKYKTIKKDIEDIQLKIDKYNSLYDNSMEEYKEYIHQNKFILGIRGEIINE